MNSILTINGGSSSIKFALYKIAEPMERLWYGMVDRIGMSGTNLTFCDPIQNKRDGQNFTATDLKSLAKVLIDWFEQQPNC